MRTLVFGAQSYSQANNDSRGGRGSPENTLIHLVWGKSEKVFWWRQSLRRKMSQGRERRAQWRQTQERGVKPEGTGTEGQRAHQATQIVRPW